MRYVVQPYIRQARIRPEVYGNFSEHLGRCIYEGVYVGEDSPIPNVNGMRTDIVEALRRMKLPVLRWPGGCFADTYHWRDGVGPRAERKKMINTNWGGVVEDNSFGTHEFMELCRQVGCEPYINGNLGSGTVQEMSEWVEYMTFGGLSPMSELRKRNGHEQPWRLKYFGVGNENWGCGGNMTAQHYSDEYRRYQTYLMNYGDNRLYKIACGPGTSPEAPNYDWTETMMRNAGGMMDGLSLHYYTTIGPDWQHKGSATDFTAADYYNTMGKGYFIEELLTKHSAIMDRYDPQRRVGLIVDEWGTWFDVEPGTNPGFLYQQNTMRDAMLAGMTLNCFNKHAERVHMANIAQLINVLQAVALTDGERMLLTPTYHVFEMYSAHQGAERVASTLAAGVETAPNSFAYPDVSESASVDGEGALNVTLCNFSLDTARPIEMLIDQCAMELSEGRVLTGAMDAHNTFEAPEAVTSAAFGAVKCESTPSGTEARFELPPCSVVRLTFRAEK